MGSITTAIPNTFKVEVLKKVHNFTTSSGDTFKMALVKDTSNLSGDLGAGTTTYSSIGADELPNADGYTTGGKTVTSVTPILSGSTAVCDFNDVTWTNVTFATAGGVIYNDTAPGKPVCAVFSFNGDQQVSVGDFQIRFPTADANTAVIRIS